MQMRKVTQTKLHSRARSAVTSGNLTLGPFDILSQLSLDTNSIAVRLRPGNIYNFIKYLLLVTNPTNPVNTTSNGWSELIQGTRPRAAGAYLGLGSGLGSVGTRYKNRRLVGETAQLDIYKPSRQVAF